MKTTNFFQDFLFPLYPLRCMLCGKPLIGEKTVISGLCLSCTRQLFEYRLRELKKDEPEFHGNLCRTCGRPLISAWEECLYCRDRSYDFVSNHSIFLYDGPVRELIQQYKFKSQSRLVYLWAYFFAHYLRHHCPSAVVVPVPGRKSSVRRRGWDQMYRLGGVLKKEYGLAVLFLLERRGGASQKTLSYEGRLHNLKGRICLKHSMKRSLKAGRFEIPDQIVLIDDIFTTGATLSECAHVLSEKGATRVKALTIGRAPY